MPIISENPKELYECLYNELKNKYGPVSVYLRDKDMLDEKEKAVGKAMEDFIKLYEMSEETFSVKKDMPKPKYGVVYSDADYSTVMKDLKKDEELLKISDDLKIQKNKNKVKNYIIGGSIAVTVLVVLISALK